MRPRHIKRVVKDAARSHRQKAVKRRAAGGEESGKEASRAQGMEQFPFLMSRNGGNLVHLSRSPALPGESAPLDHHFPCTPETTFPGPKQSRSITCRPLCHTVHPHHLFSKTSNPEKRPVVGFPFPQHLPYTLTNSKILLSHGCEGLGS